MQHGLNPREKPSTLRTAREVESRAARTLAASRGPSNLQGQASQSLAASQKAVKCVEIAHDFERLTEAFILCQASVVKVRTEMTNTRIHAVAISTRAYERAHGKSPRGYGSWAFCPESRYDDSDYLDHTMWYTGTYSDAKKSAIAYFRSTNVSVVVVCS